MTVHPLTGDGDEQPAGDHLARVDRRLRDDNGSHLGAGVGQGFDYVSQSQHLSSTSSRLRHNGVGWNAQQNDQFLYD